MRPPVRKESPAKTLCSEIGAFKAHPHETNSRMRSLAAGPRFGVLLPPRDRPGWAMLKPLSDLGIERSCCDLRLPLTGVAGLPRSTRRFALPRKYHVLAQRPGPPGRLRRAPTITTYG